MAQAGSIGRLDMDEERQTAPSPPEAAEPKICTAADARRERFQLSQTVAGQVARFRAGGRVTVLPEVADAPLNSSARGPDQKPDPA